MAARRRTGRRSWGEALGLLPVAGSLAMAIGYSVVVGWLLKYTVGSFTGAVLANEGVAGFDAYFSATASAWGNTGWQAAAMVLAFAVMALGIGGGIEQANKVLMPMFFVLFAVLAVYIGRPARAPWTGIGICLCCVRRSCWTLRYGSTRWGRRFFPCPLRATAR